MLPHEDTTGRNTPDPYVGKVFDKYRLIERLGAGGMGWVYRAEQARIKRHVAVKMLPLTMGNDEVYVKRIEREATAMGNLRHPNIATIFDFGFSDEGRPYLVMELISGRSLGSLLQEERTLDPQRALRIMTQIADAMDYAHKNGIIHRDLKPDNVMLTSEHKEDFVKILDFGIAKSVDTVVNVSQSLTRPGTVVGSPLYMSPEQCLGQKLDAGSDIYALGVMLYELVTGVIPCKGATIYETICRKTTEAPPPFPADFAELKELERLAQQCLAPMRADRPESMQVVRDRLIALQPATFDMAMPVSVQISTTVESVAVAQHAAVSNLPSAPTPSDIYGAPRNPSDMADSSQSPHDSDRRTGTVSSSSSAQTPILQTPSQIIASIPEITQGENTVVTSTVHDTATDLEIPLASGLEVEAGFATVSAAKTVPVKSGNLLSGSRKLAVIGATILIALGGLAFKIISDSSTATMGGDARSSSASPIGAGSGKSTVPDPSPSSVSSSNSDQIKMNNSSASTNETKNSSAREMNNLNRTKSAVPPSVDKSLNARTQAPVASSQGSKKQVKNISKPNRKTVSKTRPVQRSPRRAAGRKEMPGPIRRFMKHVLNGRF